MRDVTKEITEGRAMTRDRKVFSNGVRGWVFFVLISAIIAIPVGIALGDVFTRDDTEWYLKIAEGRISEAMQPFTSRQLGPLLAGATSHLFHIDLKTSFLAQGVLSLLVLLGIIGFFLYRNRSSAWLCASIGGLAFWSFLFNGLVLPDLIFSAILACFLLLLDREHYLLSALMLFPLFVTRESAILVLPCLAVAGWKRMRLLDGLTALVMSIAGTVVVKRLAAGGLPNQEHVGPLLYLVGKVPWNFMKNMVGVALWNDRNPWTCAVPVWQTSVHLGGMHSIGVCAYDPERQLETLFVALTCFGALPLISILLLRRKPSLLWPDNVMLRFCVLYGGIAFVIGPSIGAALQRLVGYSWPMFVVAVPAILQQIPLPDGRRGVAIVVLHLGISWLPVIDHFAGIGRALHPAYCVVIVAAYFAIWRLMGSSSAVLDPSPVAEV